MMIHLHGDIRYMWDESEAETCYVLGDCFDDHKGKGSLITSEIS